MKRALFAVALASVFSVVGAQQFAPARSAKIEQALEAIIPTPFSIELDRRVPRDWSVSWSPSENWMKTLRAALEPMGLAVDADWTRSVVRVRATQVAESAPAQRRVTVVDAVSAASTQWPELAAAASPGWTEAAPYAPRAPVLVGRAIASVIPSEFRSMAIEYQGVDPALMVTWAGKSRMEALRSIEQQINARVRLGSAALSVVSNSYRPAAVAAAAQPAAIETGFVLVSGQPLQAQLEAWARRAGWAVVWRLDADWIVPNGADFGPSFQNAAKAVIDAMSKNGADVRATFHEGNRTLVIAAQR